MNGIEKLQQDLKVLEHFVEEIPSYLRGDVLFRPISSNLPQLTLGGYLMRQYRLLLMRDLLTDAEKVCLDNVVTQFQTALSGNIVRFETHTHKELDARLRQWTEYLRDIQTDKSAFNYYQTAVEARVIIDAIIGQLEFPPYQLNSSVPKRIVPIDLSFRAWWYTGDFVWPVEWEAAYPIDDFWYLYGKVK